MNTVYLGDLPSKVVAVASWPSFCLHFACARIQPIHREDYKHLEKDHDILTSARELMEMGE